MVKIHTTFSIVVPVGPNFKNHENLAEILNAIDFPRELFEIILALDVNVCSGPTKELLQKLDFLGITASIVQNPGPKGPGIARNTGIKEAKNEYILFLDTDDRILPNALNDINNVASDQEVIFYNFRRLDKNKKAKSVGRKDFDFFSTQRYLLEGALKNQLEQECWQASYKRTFLLEKNVTFTSGIFEDMQFSLICLSRMTNYKVLESILYEKNDTEGSITSTISEDGISHYINAWLEMAKFAIDELGEEKENFLRIGIQNVVGQFVSRIVGSNESPENQFRLIKHLQSEVEKQTTISNVSSARNSVATLYGDIYKFLTESSKKFTEISDYVNQRSKLEFSCGDIENSVFLAPDEIRTCCKRFFVNGKIKGDVVLDVKIEMDENQPKKVTTHQIQQAKEKLKRSINIGNENACTGCPYLELKEWRDEKKGFDIKYLSMEQHSICNLRCTYCDEKYYGGLNPKYDVAGSLKDFHDNGVTSNLQTVVWGGGEPTLDPNFSEMLKGVSEVAPSCEHRFLSNSKRFSQEIYDALSLGHSQLVTSMDAGSESKYLEIRGRKGYSDVLHNLSRYSEIRNNSLVIKYIFTSENQEFSELEKFVEDVVRFNLTENVFQISYDFKSEMIDRTGSLACLYLFALLYDVGAQYIYFDDLLLTRFESGTATGFVELTEEIKARKATNCFGDPLKYSDITLYGAGDQAERMVKKFDLLNRFPITSVVENNLVNPRKVFHGLYVQNLSVLVSNHSKIFLAGVQSVPQMLKSLANLGIPKNRIIREMLI